MDLQLERQFGPRAVGRIAAACVVFSMATGVIAFVITPRQLAQQLGMATAPFVKSPTTDFSDQITLGAQGNISQDGTPVIDVRIVPDAGGAGTILAPGPIYLRGAILSDYDKRTHKWTTVKRGKDDENRQGPPEEKENRRSLTTFENPPVRNRREYEIIQRSTKPGPEVLLFAPFQPSVVTCDADTKLIYQKSDAILRMMPSLGGRLAYHVTSVPDARDPNAIAAQPDPANLSAEIRELAARLLTERAIKPDPYQDGPLEVRRASQAMIGHLAGFEYSLQMIAPDSGEDPIDMFLFKTRRGHCEYFAAAMVQMLRAVRVPARIATGYVAAEYNSVSGYFTVRKSDAHAWVEVEMEPGRWETFDPTPPGELQSTRRAGGGPVAWLKHLWDAIEFSWLDNVVAYDKGLKLDVAGLAGRSDPGEAAVKWQNRIRAWQEWVKSHLPQNAAVRSVVVGLATFALVLTGYGLVRVIRRSARASGPASPSSSPALAQRSRAAWPSRPMPRSTAMRSPPSPPRAWESRPPLRRWPSPRRSAPPRAPPLSGSRPCTTAPVLVNSR
ncbi:MAG: transglutaminaseTgpA domain-containing protein [Phycisphaerales bacterium]